jgi:LuxR family transcriptional regulator, maltose regulon positive regulatory protein
VHHWNADGRAPDPYQFATAVAQMPLEWAVLADRRTDEPAAGGLVLRRRLFDRLSAAGPGAVILACAPAGSGKTVLLRSWVEFEGWSDRVAWVSVERDEHDAQRFWLAVIDELAGAVGQDELVRRVGATPTFGGEAVVERLLSDLHTVERPIVLVIDDLHELRSAEALRLLELFLTALPPELRVVLATREEPQLGLHRLRLTGALIEIRMPDLRFSLQDTRELMAASGVKLSETALVLLHERTEGWAAGLRLAAISLTGHPDPERFVTEFSGSERTVAGYLLAEVLERQPPEVRDLLLRTSVLERVSGSLADALTGGTGSEAILQRLEDASAFVTSLDVGRSWFRYHHLLTDLLRLELRRTAPAIVDPLHRVAARWFDEHGHAVEAIRHAQAARDWAHAARVLADNNVDLVFDGRKATLRALLAAFPADAPEEDAELALACATGRLYDGLLDESALHVAVAERLAATVPAERRGLFDLRLTSARLWLASQRGDVDTARQGMPSLEARASNEPVRGQDHRASALMQVGIAELWSLQVDDARRDLEEALALARRIGRPYLEIGCLGHLALATVMSGPPVPVGLRLSEEAVTIAEAHGWEGHRIVAPAVAAGAAALAWLGRIDEAERWLDRVDHGRAPVDEFDVEPVLHYTRAFVRLGQGRFEEALAEFRAAERIQPVLAREHVLPVEVRAWVMHTQILMGDTAAVRTALAALGPDERGGAGMRIAAAALALTEGRPQDAVDVVAPMLADVAEPAVERASQVVNLRRATVHALLLDAAAWEELGDSRAAERSIERALELAERDGMFLQFMLVPVRELLERHPRHRTAHATLLSTILDVLAGGSPPTGGEATPLREQLSEAELRVIRYLPSNLKAPEIAAELFVSPNTVRTHLRHIYAKLDAHSRSEAVARARELRLLGPGARSR